MRDGGPRQPRADIFEHALDAGREIRRVAEVDPGYGLTGWLYVSDGYGLCGQRLRLNQEPQVQCGAPDTLEATFQPLPGISALQRLGDDVAHENVPHQRPLGLRQRTAPNLAQHGDGQIVPDLLEERQEHPRLRAVAVPGARVDAGIIDGHLDDRVIHEVATKAW